MASDRVGELCRGEICNPQLQQTCRDRIHWMCAHVRGERILDVGCSQGIATFLLGQEGYQVIGVDIDPAAIEFAQQELAGYPESIQNKIKFQLVVPPGLPFEDASFDFVLLGEVLERLSRPELMLAEVRRVLKPGGTVAITTPFGVHPDPGHAHTFYLGQFLQAVEPFFQTSQLRILDRYICYTGLLAKPAGEQAGGSVSAERLLQLSEEAFKLAELAYLKRIEARESKCKTLSREVAALNADVRTSRNEITKLSNRLATAERWHGNTVQLVQQLESLMDKYSVNGDLARISQRTKRIAAKISGDADTVYEFAALGGVIHDLFEALSARSNTKKQEFDSQLRHAAQEYADELRRVNESHCKREGELQRVIKSKTNQIDQLRRAEKKVQQLQAHANRQAETINYFKEELKLKQKEIRYCLGDVFVKAATSPTGLVLLPYRFVRLFIEGLRRRGERHQAGEDEDSHQAESTKNLATPQESTPESNTAPQTVAATANATTGSPISDTASTASSAIATPSKSDQPGSQPMCFQPVLAPDREPRLALKAAVIMDEFTYECFKGECELMRITPQDWKNTLSQARPDFLFVESAWKGNGGTWSSRLTRAHLIPDNPLFALVDWCKAHNIPTVFWNKEDPPNFKHFIDVAKRFDYIFTTDAHCIERYRRQVEHDRVYALPFAAQAAIHNPIGPAQPLYGNLCFAGTYYAKRHADRRGDIDLLLKPAISRGLVIFDRMHGSAHCDYYRFPPEYQQCIHGALPYPEMVDAYKRFAVFLNVNSVKDSPTMFSRRVFELLACGTPVISTYALGIEKLLGHESVALVETAEEAEEWMDALINNPELRDRMVLRAQRRIFHEHTYQQRMEFILEQIGIKIERPPRGVSVITCINRPDQLENAIANYKRQLWPEKELVLVLNGEDFVLDDVHRRLESVPNARTIQLPESSSLGECLNTAVEESRLPYWTRFDQDNFYAENFLTDLMAAFVYSTADIVGKCTYYTYLEDSRCLALRFPNQEHRYVKFLSGSAMIMARRVFDEVRFPGQRTGGDAEFLKDCVEKGFKLYSADRFNYVARRVTASDEHTQEITDDEYLRECHVISHTDDYRGHVIA